MIDYSIGCVNSVKVNDDVFMYIYIIIIIVIKYIFLNVYLVVLHDC